MERLRKLLSTDYNQSIEVYYKNKLFSITTTSIWIYKKRSYIHIQITYNNVYIYDKNKGEQSCKEYHKDILDKYANYLELMLQERIYCLHNTGTLGHMDYHELFDKLNNENV